MQLYIVAVDKTVSSISGNFGGGVQSYFQFLRFLVVLNFVSFLLIAAFVIIPSVVFRSVGSSPSNNTGNVFIIIRYYYYNQIVSLSP